MCIRDRCGDGRDNDNGNGSIVCACFCFFMNIKYLDQLLAILLFHFLYNFFSVIGHTQ